MKKNKFFVAVLCMILFTVLLTWILPVNYFSGELVKDARSQVGLFDLLGYPSIALSYFGNNLMYLLIIGGFYGVLYKIGAYRSLLDKLADKTKGHEKLVLILIISVISVLVAVTGATLGIWMIIPFIISLVLLMGFDKITAALVSIGSIAMGTIGNLFSSTYITDGYNLSSQNGAGILNSLLNVSSDIKKTVSTLLIPKIIVLILGVALLVFLTLRHISKSLEKETDIDEFIPKAVSKKEAKSSLPLIVILDVVLLVSLLAFVSWSSVFNTDAFTKATEAVLTKFKIFKFPILGKILGKVNPFEQWSIVEMSSLLLMASALIGVIYKVKFKEFFENFFNGVKKALKPAVLVVLAYVVLVIVSYNPITLTIIKPIITLTKSFNVFTMSISALISSIFNVDIYYIATNNLQYILSVVTNTKAYSLIGMIWYSMYGFASLVSPTSVILVAVLSYLDIPYKKWIKSNWLLLLATLCMLLVVFTICMLVMKL